MNHFTMQELQSDASFEEIRKSEKFVIKNNEFSKGYDHSNYWFKIKVKNSTKLHQKYILEFSEAFAHICDFYIVSKDHNVLVVSNGLHTPLEKRIWKNQLPGTEISFKPDETKTIFIHYQSRFTAYGAFTFYSPQAYQEKNIIYTAFFSFYFGAVLIMVFYNLFLYFSFRDKSYIFYISYAMSFALWVFLYSGFSLYFINSQWHYILHFSTPISFVLFAYFSKSILDFQDILGRFSKLFEYSIWALFLSSIWVVIDLENGYESSNVVGIFFFLVFLYLGFASLRKNIKAANFYLIALIIYLSGMSLVSNLAMGILDFTIINKYAFIVGSLLEITLFSFVLAYKINILKQEKLQTQEKLLELQNAEANILEKMVDKKTKELMEANQKLHNVVLEREVLLKEIHHRVKNNLQVVIGLLWLQSNQAISEDTQAILLNSSNRIKSIALLHELLYASHDFQKISSREYLLQLIKLLQDTSSYFEGKYDINIEDIDLDIDTGIALGTILVETISNVLKHAFDDTSKGLICVTLTRYENCISLIVSDNGKGFNMEDIQDKGTLGLKLVNQMCSKLSNSKIRYINKTGMNVILEFDHVV